MREKVPVVALLLSSALLSQPALARERVIGLLALPEVLAEVRASDLPRGPCSCAPRAKFARLAADQPVRVRRASRETEGLWFLVDIMSHGCEGDGGPTVVDQGWVPAYGKADVPTIWFHSRGC